MAVRPSLRVLFFDVFGTCVAQRGPVADELSKAANEALASHATQINGDVRKRAEDVTYDDWFDFGGEWNRAEDDFVAESKANHGNVDWIEVDRRRMESFGKLLADRGLTIPRKADGSSTLDVEAGSLWSTTQLQHLARVWHRLPPWPDTCRGLELLNTKYTTVALSNTYNDLIHELANHSSIPFKEVYSSDMFHSFKPNPKVYLGAAEKLGVKPEECALVAAHLGDLKGAKACGFYAIYVVRPLEEKAPALRQENIPDLVVEEATGGFVTLAKRLGID